jgi:hypothetical protein
MGSSGSILTFFLKSRQGSPLPIFFVFYKNGKRIQQLQQKQEIQGKQCPREK